MIVVTGAAGFIGSNFVASLNAAGRHDLVLCDWLGHDEKWRNLGKAAFVDFVSPPDLRDWLRRHDGVEAVIHMGAISATTATDGDEMLDRNFRASLALLDHCTAAQIPFLYASSGAVYGDGGRGFDDSLDPADILTLRPLNLYGWSKRQFDFVFGDRKARGAALPPSCIGVRYFNVFGPNEYHKGDMRSIVAKIAEPVARGETVPLFRSYREGIGDGEQRRDFVYVKDAVSASLDLLAARATGIFNVGTGRARSFNDLVRAVFAAHGQEPRIGFVDMPVAMRGKYQYFTEASLERLYRAGCRPAFASLEQSVADYVLNYLAQDDAFR